MSKRKLWAELTPAVRARRFESIAARHLPTVKPLVTMAARHAGCANGPACTGPGCQYTR